MFLQNKELNGIEAWPSLGNTQNLDVSIIIIQLLFPM